MSRGWLPACRLGSAARLSACVLQCCSSSLFSFRVACSTCFLQHCFCGDLFNSCLLCGLTCQLAVFQFLLACFWLFSELSCSWMISSLTCPCLFSGLILFQFLTVLGFWRLCASGRARGFPLYVFSARASCRAGSYLFLLLFIFCLRFWPGCLFVCSFFSTVVVPSHVVLPVGLISCVFVWVFLVL